MDAAETNIIAKIQHGEPERFVELYDAYLDKIYKYIYYRTFHTQTAEDLTSQVFLKALENIRSYNARKGSFSAWIYRIARNTVIDYQRTKKPVDDLTAAEGVRGSESAAEATEAALLQQQVEQILDSLPAQERDVVTMRIWDGLSYAEIAAITEKSEASLKMQFSRTISKLRSVLPTTLLAFILTFYG